MPAARILRDADGHAPSVDPPFRRFLWLPVPAFIILFLVAGRFDTGAAYEPRLLLPALNVAFLMTVSALVSWLAARSYLQIGSTAVLLVGCGMLAFGVSAGISGAAVFVRANRDVTVTAYNVGAFVAGLCCFIAAVLVGDPKRRPDLVPVSRRTIAVAYGAVLLFAIGTAIAAYRGHTPRFFVEGYGPTTIRQIVLGAAVAMFAAAALVFWVLDRRAPSTFVRWYSFGLLLIAIGLGGVSSQNALGSPIGWTGRAAQYVGAIYIAVGVFALRREGEAWGIPLDEILRETHVRYRALVDLNPDAILVHTAGRYVFANAAAGRLFGVASPDLLIGAEVLASVHPDSRAFVAGRIARAQAGTPSPLDELKIVRFDGTVADVEATGAQVTFHGRPAVQVVMRDIGRRKRIEAELREHADKLDEANRVKDQFLATLSHELRTPLTAIVGWAHMLSRGQLDESGSRRAVDAIYRNARAQQSLIDDVLDVSRIISGKLRFDVRPVAVEPSLEAAISSVAAAAAAKQIELSHDIDPDAIVLGDANRLQQILWNLLSNAVKFTEQGGRIHAAVKRTDGAVEISVRDSGMGIAPDVLPHVFERFWQADRKTTRRHGGLGLGLAIVRHLVELHGGTVTAESAGETHGATFTVQLPGGTALEAAPDPERDSPPPPFSPAVPEWVAPALSGLSAVVVDDQEDAREFVSSALRSFGVDVRAVATAEEAMQAVRSAPPHVLLSDIGMPGEDGYSLIRRIRALPRSEGGCIPAIALTAYGREADRTAALAAGYTRHLAKPVIASDLALAVASLVGPAN